MKKKSEMITACLYLIQDHENALFDIVFLFSSWRLWNDFQHFHLRYYVDNYFFAINDESMKNFMRFDEGVLHRNLIIIQQTICHAMNERF